MKEITAYMTTDGKLFDNLEEAQQHEVNTSNDYVVEAFLNSDCNSYPGGPQRAIAKTTILNWIRWKND